MTKYLRVVPQISDPDEDPIFDERISIGAKTKELDYKIDKRGVYQMCYELSDGELRLLLRVC